MLKLSFDRPHGSTYRLLCLGAHADDLEIGCGGTVISLLKKYNHLEFYWVVLGSNPVRECEARASAERLLERAKSKTVVVKEFRDSFFPYDGRSIKEYFEQLKNDFCPDLIFTHYRHDLHQDHKLVSDLTWNTFRDHLILEYEIPKYDGDLGSPNLFVPLEETVVRTKLKGILDCFKSQVGNHWFSEELFTAALRIRGIECNAPTGFAEAFHCRKILI